MKKFLLFIFTLIYIQAFGQRTPGLEMLIFPKYIEGYSTGARGEVRGGIPYVYRAKITGLAPLTTYRYQNKIVGATTATPGDQKYLFILPPDNVIPGTGDYTPGNFFMPPITSNGNTNGSEGETLTANYGLLTTDASGSYTGWFIQETIKYPSDAAAILRISLNDPASADPTAIAYALHSPADQPLTVLGMAAKANSEGNVHFGTAIRSTPSSAAIPENFVFLYDNAEGTGRPIAGTFIENDGVESALASSTTGLGAFYFNNVNKVNGAWGTMVLNSDANGIRRIEQRKLSDGSIVGYNTSADGSWADGANPGSTVPTALTTLGANAAGTTAIVLDGSVVTLGAVKTPQTVTFTNTFPTTFKVGDPDFTLSASSSAGLTAFQYTVAPAGILEITGSTVKIVGGEQQSLL